MTRGVVVAGIVLCAVPAPACKHSSPKSFHARALEICARYPEPVELSFAVRELRRLRPPPARSAVYRRWLVALDGLARVRDRGSTVLDRDQVRIQAALRREKIRSIPTRAELQHPTILLESLTPLPEWHAYVRDFEAVQRAVRTREREVVRLTTRLQLQDCFR
jgi:hypothetical protein